MGKHTVAVAGATGYAGGGEGFNSSKRKYAKNSGVLN